ncbi:MAG: tetratricopeptide repeat protein [Promethearchaeota archaeon]|jgi:tetratricopeptide (TPR) repeat protein
MTDPKPKELIQAEELIKVGNIEEALEIVRKFQQTAWVYNNRRKSDEALKIALQCKELIEKIGKENDLASNVLLLGWIYSQKGDIKSSLNFGIKSIDLHEKLDLRIGLSSSLLLVGINHMNNFDFDQSINFCERALSIKEIIPTNKLGILSVLGVIYTIKGDLAKALKISEEGLKLANKGNFYYIIPSFMWYLGNIHAFLGDIEKGEDYFKRNLELLYKYPDKYSNGFTLMGLIILLLEKNSYEQARDYLKQLGELKVKNKGRFFEKFITSCYSISKGIILKVSGRTRDRAEAETLLRKVVENEISSVQELTLKIYAMTFLCDLYIEELGSSNDSTIIDDINPLISKMFNNAEKLQSNLIMIGVNVLQAKMELIQMNFGESKIILTKALQLAELNDNQYYAQIISHEHDRLLEQQDLWDKIEKTNAPFSERIKLASFDGVLDRIRGKRYEEPIEVIDEKPVLLLLIAEGGVLIFSYPFADEWQHDTEIFGSFLSAFTSFSDEFFSKGLDRVKFGDDTLLIQTVDSFSVGYLYKGQTYPAKQKLAEFSEEIKNNTSIWQTLDTFSKTSQVAEIQDIPQIENLIKDIFIS